MAIIGDMTGTTDVSINLATQIRDVLNAAGGSVTNDTTTFFSSAAKLNMWSKYKPVVSTELFYSFALWKSEGYRGDDGKCGLTINTWSTISSFRTNLENGTALWSYTPPTGGTTQPMRLGDFRGYNTDAVNPIGEITTDGYSQNGSSTVEGNVTFSVDVATGMENNLEYSDIRIGGSNGTPLTDYYLGIYAVKGTSYKYKTNTVPLGSNYNFTVDIPLTTGEWKVIPFFCSSKQTGTETSGTYLSANIPARTFTIISTSDKIEFTIYGTWNSTKTKVQSISMSVKNNSSEAVVVSNIAVSLWGQSGTTENNVGSPAYVYYSGSSSSTLSVPAGSTVTTTSGEFASITLGDANENYEYFLRATGYIGDTLYSDTYQIEEIVDEV